MGWVLDGESGVIYQSISTFINHYKLHKLQTISWWLLLAISDFGSSSSRRTGRMRELVRRKVVFNFKVWTYFASCQTRYLTFVQLMQAATHLGLWFSTADDAPGTRNLGHVVPSDSKQLQPAEKPHGFSWEYSWPAGSSQLRHTLASVSNGQPLVCCFFPLI